MGQSARHAAQGNWQVVAQPHLQPAITDAEQLLHQQQAHPQQLLHAWGNHGAIVVGVVIIGIVIAFSRLV